MRDAFMAALTEQAQSDSRVNLIIADIGFKVVDDFVAKMPDQFLNVGIAEQTMIGVAAGMASLGKRPIAYSLGNFPTIRCLEQIRNDLCYHDLDVTVVSVGAGLAYGTLGYTHHTVEDIALMRALPNMKVYSPADALECRAVVELLPTTPGPKYIRLGKNKEPRIHETQPDLSTGAPVLVRDGSDVTLIAVGPIVTQAIEAADALSERGISVRLLTCPVIKPLNISAIRDAAAGTVGIVTLEEHTLMGGFGSAVLEALAVNSWRIPVLPLALNDAAAATVGSQEYLREHNGLATDSVITRIADFTASV
jgi:transketolase